jgi:diguanylate cyclase (GGDEF)-like protein
VRVNETEIPVTASFGVASYPDLVRTRDALFQAADAALYGAKRDGRNCVRVAEVSGLSVLT